MRKRTFPSNKNRRAVSLRQLRFCHTCYPVCPSLFLVLYAVTNCMHNCLSKKETAWLLD